MNNNSKILGWFIGVILSSIIVFTILTIALIQSSYDYKLRVLELNNKMLMYNLTNK